MRGRQQFLHPPLPQYGRRLVSRGSSQAACHSSPCKWINPAFIFPNLHVRNASVFGLSDSWEWLRIHKGGKKNSSGCGEKLFQTKNVSSSALALGIQQERFFFFLFFVRVNTAALLISPLRCHGCNIGGLSCKATVIQQQTCCDRLGPIELQLTEFEHFEHFFGGCVCACVKILCDILIIKHYFGFIITIIDIVHIIITINKVNAELVWKHRNQRVHKLLLVWIESSKAPMFAALCVSFARVT